MPVIAPTPITALPTPPSTADAANFDTRADAFLGALPLMTTETNAVADNVFDNATDAATNAANAAASAATAQAIGNFRGNWADLAGALNVPATVRYSGVYWQLLSNVANVAVEVPGVSIAWTQMTPVPISSGGTGGTTAAAARAALDVGFPSGTAMLVAQTAAPTGWTKSVTHNNKALRVVSGSASSGGSVAFTTAFASQAVGGTVNNTTLTIAQMPSHSHTTSGFATAGGTGVDTGTQSGATLTGSQGGDGAHNHSFTGTAINLAVQYVDVIIATKD